MKAGSKTILVDLLDALAEGVVGVGSGLRCGLAGGETVEAVVGEAGGAGALGVAVGGAGAGLAAFLVEPVGRAVDVGHGAGVAGLALAVAVFVVAVAEAASGVVFSKEAKFVVMSMLHNVAPLFAMFRRSEGLLRAN